MRKLYAFLLSNIIILAACFSQDTTLQIPLHYYNKIAKKANSLQEKISHQSTNLLSKLESVEQSIYQRLYQLDSLKVKDLMADGLEHYNTLQKSITEKTNVINKITSGTYIPGLDSMQGALGYLSKVEELSNVKQLQNALDRVKQISGSLQQAELIKKFINERKQQLQAIISQYSNAPAIVTRQLQSFSKEVYYYKQKIKDYQNILNDPSKIEQTALALLNKVPAFKKFMQENGMLAGLFDSPSEVQNIEGLQTQANVQNILQQRLSLLGPDARAVLQNNVQAAQDQLRSLKEKFPALNSTEEMPDFKPNEMKSKSILQRIGIGGNLQFNKSQGTIPNSTDIALMLSYKLNDKSSVGIGAAYKMGLGSGINHIAITHEGIGFRMFIDWKLKGNFYVNGGYERNYFAAFKNISELKNASWKTSALIGISKKYNINSKLKGNIMLLYDFLYQQKTPITQPVIFRIGYGI